MTDLDVDKRPGEPPDPEDVAALPRTSHSWKTVREWILVVVVAISAAIVIRTFVFQQFYISGPSMRTTLSQNDRVLVNKLSYRLHDVNRGDVVVFDRVTTNGGTVQHDDLIKRVIGLGGETVEIRSCEVFIDGRQLNEPYLDPVHLARPDPASRCNVVDLDPQLVPDGYVFVMGDNRAESFDSRMFGPIDRDLIVGRAFVVLWPPGSWRWL
jgi:signal peptidase I